MSNAIVNRKSRKLAAVVGGLLALGMSSTSFGAVLISFDADPAAPALAEIQWTGTQLVAGPGASQALTIKVENGITTTYSGATLVLDGLAAAGAVDSTVVGGMTVLAQPVGAGTFEIIANDGVTTLLTGTISNALVTGIVGVPGFETGSVQAPSVVFTGGQILTDYMGGEATPANLSWALLNIKPALGANGNLSAFSADSVGLLSQIPEPATLSALAFGLMLFRRSRKA